MPHKKNANGRHHIPKLRHPCANAEQSWTLRVGVLPVAMTLGAGSLTAVRLGWQEVTGYGKRALVEAAMGHYKSLISERLRSRGDAARRTEAVVGATVLNRMLDAAKPNSVRRSAAPA